MNNQDYEKILLRGLAKSDQAYFEVYRGDKRTIESQNKSDSKSLGFLSAIQSLTISIILALSWTNGYVGETFGEISMSIILIVLLALFFFLPSFAWIYFVHETLKRSYTQDELLELIDTKSKAFSSGAKYMAEHIRQSLYK